MYCLLETVWRVYCATDFQNHFVPICTLSQSFALCNYAAFLYFPARAKGKGKGAIKFGTGDIA